MDVLIYDVFNRTVITSERTARNGRLF